MSIVTVYSHIATLYEGGHNIDLYRYVSKGELEAIGKAIGARGQDAKLKELHEYLDGEFDYGKIRLALAWAARQG